MTYVLAPDGVVVAYPYSFGRLRADNPDVSFPRDIDDAWLAAQGIHKVEPVARPPSHPAKIVSEGTPDLVEGVWTQVWTEADAPVPTKAQLVDYAKLRRWKKEIGGIVFAGIPIATDDRSQQKIIGARVAADADPQWSTVWNGSDNGLYPVNATAMVAISTAVHDHVNSCFTVYAAVISDIESGAITTYAEVEGAFT